MNIPAIIENILSRRRGPRKQMKVGINVAIKKNVVFHFPKNIRIGDNVQINEFSVIHGMGGVEIGNDTRIGYGVKIISFNHNFKDRDIPIRNQGYDVGMIRIGNDTWIGTNAVILKGVTIGEGSVIGANAVVTKNIPSYSIAVGIPAKVVGKRGEDNEIKNHRNNPRIKQ